MPSKWKDEVDLKICSMSENVPYRYLNPSDINVESGYKIEVFAEGLNTPTSILFTQNGDLYIADSGYIDGNPTISRYVNGNFEVIADNFNVPLIGITEHNRGIYVSHRGTITLLNFDGNRQDIITGLPSYGDYSNSKVAFGPDGKMYFGQGTATNSGVVGLDNSWVSDYPFFHDYPGAYIILNGQNFESNNMFIKSANEITNTGAFSPYGIPNLPFEVKKGVIRASGSILRSNPDGTELELVAWGLRSVSYLRYDRDDRLFASNNGFDIRGSRPIANAPDEFQLITQGTWYGWPDFAGGEPVTNSRFQPEEGVQPEFLLVSHPQIPPKPFSIFPPNSTIIGFDFNYNRDFGPIGDVYIAEFGNVRPRTIRDTTPLYTGRGYRVSRIEMRTGGVTTFAINKSGFPASLSQEGGFGRPADIAFGPDGALYILDMGTNSIDNPNVFIPNTGVIWKVTRSA